MILFISEFIIMFMFHAITAMVLESAITTRLGGRLICTCGIINDKLKVPSLASNTSSSVVGDHVFWTLGYH